MIFTFKPNKMPMNLENLGHIGRDVLKMIYFYHIETCNEEYKKIIPKEDYKKLVDDANVHIKPLVLILKLLDAMRDSKTPAQEKNSLEKYINQSLLYEMFFLENMEISNEEDFKLWLSATLIKIKNGQDFLN